MNPWLFAASVVCSAVAQIFMKLSSGRPTFGVAWFGWMFGAAAFYGSSFFLYSLLLRREALSRLSPLSAISVMVLVVLAGLAAFGEHLTMRRGIGILLGIAAIFLLAE